MYWATGYWAPQYWPVVFLYWPWIGNNLTAKVSAHDENLLDILIAEAPC